MMPKGQGLPASSWPFHCRKAGHLCPHTNPSGHGQLHLGKIHTQESRWSRCLPSTTPSSRSLAGIRSFLVRQVIIRSTVLTQHQVTSNGHFIQRDRFASVQHSIREGFISDRMTELFIASMPKQGRSIGVILRAQAMIRFPGTNKLFPVGRYAPVYLSRKDSFIRPQGCSRRERDPIYLHLMPTRGKMYGRKK